MEQEPSPRPSRPQAPLPTVAQAIEVLQSCQADVQRVLAGTPLRVRFDGLGSFQQNPARCHVLYGKPVDPDGDHGRLKAVCGELGIAKPLYTV